MKLERIYDTKLEVGVNTSNLTLTDENVTLCLENLEVYYGKPNEFTPLTFII